MERYRALEEERRRHETLESRLYTRLEAVEEELRTTRATAADAGDDGHWREQVRILTSDLSTVRTLVGSIEAENSRLVQENERLSREDISVQQESAGLTTDQLTREREDVDMFGGQGTRAHQRMTTRRLDPGNPWVRERTTGLTWSQPEHDLQCLEAGGETETNSCSRQQTVTRGDYPHPTLGTLPQERLIERRGS